MFDHFLGKGHYTTIFCGQGELLFLVKELSKRTHEYLATVKVPGQNMPSQEKYLKNRSGAPYSLYPREVFESMADAKLGIKQDNRTKGSG